MAQARNTKTKLPPDVPSPVKDEHRGVVPSKRKEDAEDLPLASKPRAAKKQKASKSVEGVQDNQAVVSPPVAITSNVTLLGKASTEEAVIGGSTDSDDDGDYLSVWAIARGLKEEDDVDEEGDSKDSDNTSGLYPASRIKLPLECEVFDEAEQAESLRDLYKNLPNLSARAFMSWADVDSGGRMNYDHWKSLSAMKFVSFQRVVHLARCDPRVFAARTTPSSGRSRLMTMNNSDVAIISVVPLRVSESHLKTPGSLGRKYVRGFMHTQDQERFISVICMVFGEDSMHCNMKGDEYTFETWGEGKRGGDSLPNSPYKNQGSGSSPSKAVVASKQSSAVLSGGSGITAGYIRTTLRATDEVRIFDGRKKKINWASDIAKIHEILPQFEGEMMADSFAVVAHTVTAYTKKDKEGVMVGQAVSLNVQWVILLGSPDQKKPKKKGVTAT
ncbi:hypothetical protein PLEOSDRAFT_169423 [Pleurotus ostreatus PC15]|uniref:Uncharacterized protein n=1 Tax=Pleurotus ostreatus (strain PC15) TaxID=1137138 RepID=A0A067NBJ3_PLEO1|nr:hypothetical protein PLEOSDRAFT_169423 [Pleurotus ostreatus PC15]